MCNFTWLVVEKMVSIVHSLECGKTQLLNDAELGVRQPNLHGYRLAIGPVEPSQHVCRHVARALWHVIFIWVGLVGEGWGQRKGGGQASKQVAHHPWLNP